MTAVEDLDEWHSKIVGITESAEISSLEKYAQYALAVAARTKTVSKGHFLLTVSKCPQKIIQRVNLIVVGDSSRLFPHPQ
jgi:hypothetical protein